MTVSHEPDWCNTFNSKAWLKPVYEAQNHIHQFNSCVSYTLLFSRDGSINSSIKMLLLKRFLPPWFGYSSSVGLLWWASITLQQVALFSLHQESQSDTSLTQPWRSAKQLVDSFTVVYIMHGSLCTVQWAMVTVVNILYICRTLNPAHS